MDLRPAVSPEEYSIARALFREYVQTPGVAVCVVGFEEELANLETHYELVLLAFDDARPIGCGAMRRLPDGSAEMKRLYVRQEARGLKAGRALVEAFLQEARKRGCPALRLDTLPSMAAAQALYRSLGFQEIAPYYKDNPADAICFELRL